MMKLILTRQIGHHDFGSSTFLSIPNINVYDILDGDGAANLEHILSPEMKPAEFNRLIQELVNSFVGRNCGPFELSEPNDRDE